MRTSGDKWFRVPNTPRKHGRIRGRVTPEELATLYHKEGLSLEDITQRFRVTRQAVQLLLKTYGIPARGKSKARILALSKGKFEGRTTAQLNESLFSQCGWGTWMGDVAALVALWPPALNGVRVISGARITLEARRGSGRRRAVREPARKHSTVSGKPRRPDESLPPKTL